MTSKTIASRGARAVIVILAAIALAGEASATSWEAIPVRDAVSKADAIVRGKVASVEPLDVNSDVVVVEVAAVLKGDMLKDATIGEMLKDATIRLVATHRGAKGVHRFREGEEGIWLATKLPDRAFYPPDGNPEAIRGSDPRAQAQAMREAMASNAKHMQTDALQHEQAMAGVKTLRAWWAQAAAAGP